MTNDWIKEFEKIKAQIKAIVAENEALKKENGVLRADRDYLRQVLDKRGGEG